MSRSIRAVSRMSPTRQRPSSPHVEKPPNSGAFLSSKQGGSPRPDIRGLGGHRLPGPPSARYRRVRLWTRVGAGLHPSANAALTHSGPRSRAGAVREPARKHGDPLFSTDQVSRVARRVSREILEGCRWVSGELQSPCRPVQSRVQLQFLGRRPPVPVSGVREWHESARPASAGSLLEAPRRLLPGG